MSRLSVNIHKCFTEEVLLKLKKKKIITTLAFMDSDSELIAKISGLQFRHVLAIKDCILAKFASRIRTGDSYYNEVLREGAIIPTGIKKLDDLLQGGLYTGVMYELCGGSSCGKSQICMSIAANVSLNLHTLQQAVLFIDTKGDLSANRLVSNLESKLEEVGEAMARILVTQPKTAYDLISCLHYYIDNVTERRVRLLIVDSLAALFYQFLGDHQESASLLSNISSLMKFIAVELHAAVLVTNISTSWQGADSEEVRKAALGKFWAHIPSTRLAVSRLKGEDILLTVTKSSSIAIGSTTTLVITESGV